MGKLANSSGDVSQEIYSNLDSWAESEAQRGGSMSKDALKTILEVQARTIISGKSKYIFESLLDDTDSELYQHP